MGAFVRQEVLDLLDGHLADVEVLLVPKHGLEPPPALLVPEVGRVGGHKSNIWSQFGKLSGHKSNIWSHFKNQVELTSS